MQSEPSRHTLTLPLVNPDEENICLPLVINVISKYWGEEISLVDTEQIAKKYSGIKGSIMIEGIELAEKHGLKGYVYRGSVEDIKRKIDQGIPSIVILPGIHETVQHANIICGYDPDEGRILSYIPQPDTIGAIPETQFQRDWEQDDMTSIVLVPEDMKQIIEKQNPRYKDGDIAGFQTLDTGTMARISRRANRAVIYQPNFAISSRAASLSGFSHALSG